MRWSLIAAAALAPLAGCVSKTEVAPPSAPPRAAPPRPVLHLVIPPSDPSPAEWQDAPLSRGTWFYSAEAGGSQATFGVAASEAAFSIRCDRSNGRVVLSRGGAASRGALAIRTTYGVRSLPAETRTEPLAYVTVALPANDALLDQMAFSRGRFTVEAPGLPTLILPSWAEAARVIEDCRA